MTLEEFRKCFFRARKKPQPLSSNFVDKKQKVNEYKKIKYHSRAQNHDILINRQSVDYPFTEIKSDDLNRKTSPTLNVLSLTAMTT